MGLSDVASGTAIKWMRANVEPLQHQHQYPRLDPLLATFADVGSMAISTMTLIRAMPRTYNAPIFQQNPCKDPAMASFPFILQH
jgi:hypothetical protein